MKFLHFGDLHIWDRALDWADAFYPKRWLGLLNLSLRRHRRFPPSYAERIMEHILASDADVVVFSGDMSTMALDSEFEEAAALFAPVREKWGERFFVIPGNHDRYTPEVVRERRYERWFPYGTLGDAPGGLRRLDLDERVTLLGFDCSEPFMVRSNGILRPSLEQALDRALAALNEQDRIVVLVAHFPFANPPDHPERWDHKLLGEERLAALASRHRPAVYLHGHKHVRWALRSAAAPDTLCINCGSAGMQSEASNKQAGFVTFELNEEGEAEVLLAHRLSRNAGTLEPGSPIEIENTA